MDLAFFADGSLGEWLEPRSLTNGGKAKDAETNGYVPVVCTEADGVEYFLVLALGGVFSLGRPLGLSEDNSARIVPGNDCEASSSFGASSSAH